MRRARSNVSVPGAVAFFLDDPPNQLLVADLFGGEWGHIHPHDDGSLHLSLPTPLAERIVQLGWGEFHIMVQMGVAPPIIAMLYGPRDEDELAVAERIVEAAYVAAGGARHDAEGRQLALGLIDIPAA